MFARGERVSKVEGVVAAGNAHLANLIEFDGDAPGAAPGQGSKPNVAGFFVGEITARNGEPGIVLLAGGAAAALEESFAGLNALLVKKKFAAPAPGKIAQAVIAAVGERPGAGGSAVDDDANGAAIFDEGGAADDTGVGVNLIAQGDEDAALDIF